MISHSDIAPPPTKELQLELIKIEHDAQIAELGTDTTIGYLGIDSWVNAAHSRGVVHEDIGSGCCTTQVSTSPPRHSFPPVARSDVC